MSPVEATFEERLRKILLTWLFVSLSLPIAIQQTALGCALAFLGYRLWTRREISATPLNRPLAIFFAALVLSAVFCPSVVSSLLGLRKLWLVGAFFVVYHLLADEREAWRMAVTAMGVAVAVAAFGVSQHYTGFDLSHWLTGKPPAVEPFWFGRQEGFRTEGLFPSGITYAHNLLLPLTLVTTWLIAPQVPLWRRVSVLLAWGTMLLALLFTLTRGVWVAYAIVLLGLVAMQGRRALLPVGSCFVGLGVAITLLSPGVWERAYFTFDLQTNFARTQIWQANLDMIRDRPFLGWGYGNYKQFRAPYYQRYPQSDTNAHAHNNFLQMWVDGGVVGLAAFLFLFGSILHLGWRAYRRLSAEAEPLRTLALGGTLSVVGFLVGGCTQYNFGDAEVALAMWVIVGLLLRVSAWAEART